MQIEIASCVISPYVFLYVIPIAILSVCLMEQNHASIDEINVKLHVTIEGLIGGNPENTDRDSFEDLFYFIARRPP